MAGRCSERRIKALMVVMVILLVVAAIGIGVVLWDYHHSKDYYEAMSSRFTTEASGSGASKSDEHGGMSTSGDPENLGDLAGECPKTVDFDSLQELNPDIVGWLFQEDGVIDYPVLYSGDNDIYLRRLPDGGRATAGSIFLEESNRPDFGDSHTILYGHNMRNGSMFGTLKKYRDDEFYRTHRYIWLVTPQSSRRFAVFAWEEVPGDSFVYTVPYGPGEDFAAFLQKLRSISEVDTQVTVTDRDNILTLSTCTEGKKRFVVHAVETTILSDQGEFQLQ